MLNHKKEYSSFFSNLFFSRFGAAAAPASCNGQTVAAAVTLTFSPSETPTAASAGADVALTQCAYTSLTVTSDSSKAPIYNTALSLTGVTATTITFTANVFFAKGSSITIVRTTVTTGALYAYLMMEKASFSAVGLMMSSALMMSSTTFTDSTFDLNGLTVTTSAAAAVQVSSVTMRNTVFSLKNSIIRSTTGSAMQWLNSPMLPLNSGEGAINANNAVTLYNNSFFGEGGVSFDTQTDWMRTNTTVVSISRNRFLPRLVATTRPALRVFVGSPDRFTFTEDNVVVGGNVEVTILRETRDFAFPLRDSIVSNFIYKYMTLQNTSYNERLSFDNVTFQFAATKIDLPTATNASVSFNKCRAVTASTAAITLSFRALNGGTVSLANSNFAGTGAFAITTTFISYKLNYLQQNTTIAGCVNMKFFEIYYSNVSIVGGSSVGCTSLDGQFRSSKFTVSDSTVSPAVVTPGGIVMSFVNDWRDSSLGIVRSVVNTGSAALTSNHRLIHFTGKLVNIQHTFVGNTFANLATGGLSGLTPRSCIVGYSRKANVPAYPAITDGSSVQFTGGNKATLVTGETYLLYVNVQGGELIFDESNSARNVGTVVAAAGRFYVNMLAPSKDTIVLTLKNIVGFLQADIVRYLAVNPTHYEVISIKDSSIASILLFVHTAVGLTLAVENVTATQKVNLQGVNIESSTLVFRNVTTPSLFQSITTIYTSVVEVRDSRPNMIQHYVTSLDGCSIRFVNNVLPTSYLRLKGGLFESQMLIQNNTITSAGVYSLFLDDYDMAQSTFDVVNNSILSTYPAGALSYGFYAVKSTCLAGTDMNFVGNRITRNYHSFWAMEDYREGCTLRFSRNEFTTTSTAGYLFRLQLTGARIIHDDTNRLHFGRLYFYNKVSSHGNYFALRSSSYGSQNPNTFEWLYYNSVHNSLKDTIHITGVYFVGAFTIQFPVVEDSYVRLTQIRTTTLNVHHRQARKCTVLIENSLTTAYASLSSTNGCTSCQFDVYNTSVGTYTQFAGAATAGSAFAVRRSTMQYFISASAFTNRSGLKLASSIFSSSQTPTVALGGGWSNNSYFEMDSCTVISNYRAVAITQHATGNSTHKFTNNIINTLLTEYYYNYYSPGYGCIVYLRSVYTAVTSAPSIGTDSLLTLRNNSFNVRYAHSYVLYVTSVNGGRVVMDNGNMIRSTPATSSFGRIYINSIGTDPRGPTGGLGHTVVLANIPKMYYFHIARSAGTTSYNEKFELHNVSVAYAYIYTADSYNLKIYCSNIALTYDSYMYGTTATSASITFRGMRGRTLYQQLTAHVSSNTDFIGNVLTGKLYHSALSRGGSIVTIQDNTLTTSFAHVRGAVLDSQLFFDRNRITSATIYGLYVESFTVRNAAMTITNNFIVGSAGSAIVWTKSPVYACGDVYLHNNSLSGLNGGFEMLGQDVGAGGTVWFRRNTLQSTAASRYAFRITLGAGGRMDYDSTNTIKLGVVRAFHTYHTTRNNVFIISNKSNIYRFEWLYSLANGTSSNDTIGIDDTTVATYVLVDIPAMHDGYLNISNSRITSYASVQIKRGDNIDVVFHNTTVGAYLWFKPSTGVGQFRNSSFGVRGSSVVTIIDINGNFLNSTAYLSNVTCAQILTKGLIGRNASLVINQTIANSAYNHVADIQSVFDDGTLIVQRSTFISSGYKAFVLTQNTKGSSLHLFTDNFFSSTGVDTYYTVTYVPRFCAFCYSYGSSFPGVIGLGAGNQSAVIFRGNRFTVRYTGPNAFLAYVIVGANGRVHFDETNRNVPFAAGTTPYGLYRFFMNGATARGNYINISGWSQRIHSVIVDHLGASTDDTIEISNVLSVARIAYTLNTADNLTAVIRDLTMTSYATTLTGANMRKGTVFDISNVTTAQTMTLQMRLATSSLVSIRNSVVGIVQYQCRTLDRSKFVMDRNRFTTFTTDSVALSTVDSYGELHFANNTNIGNPASVLRMEDLVVKSGGKVIIFNNTLVSANVASTSPFYSAVFWYLSPVSAGGEVYFINNTITHMYGFYMYTTTDLLSGGVFIFRNNTLSVRTYATYAALRLLVNGGRVDFDVSNRILSGGVEIIHYAHSRNNHIVVANSTLGGSFSLSFNPATLNSTNDIYGAVNTRMTTLNAVMPTATNTSLMFDRVAATGAATLSSTTVARCNFALLGSTFPTTLVIVYTGQGSDSVFGIHNTTVGALTTITGVLNNSFVYIRGSKLGALTLAGTIYNGTVLVHDSDFTSFSGAATLFVSAPWYGGLFEFVRSRIVNVVVARSVVLSGLIYGNTVHRFVDSVIINRGTAATTTVPGACALCYARLSGTLFPSISENATLTVRNMTLMSSLAGSYLLYVTLEGGTVDIDTRNVAKGVLPDVGDVFIGLGPKSRGSRAVVANMGSLGDLEIVRTAGTTGIEGTDETIVIHNMTTLTTRIDLATTTRRMNLQVSNVTAKTSFTLVGTNVEASDLLIVNTTTATFTNTVTNVSSGSRLVVNGTTGFTTMTLASTARMGSTIVVGNSFSSAGSVTLGTPGLYSESEFIFEGNDIATATATPFTISGFTVEGKSRVIFRRNQFRVSGAYYAFLWSAPQVVKDSLVYFDANTFGIPNLVSAAAINSFAMATYVVGAGSIFVFRRNVFTTPIATPVVFRAYVGGGTIDLDGSNSLRKGRVEITFNTNSVGRGNRVTIRDTELSYLYCSMATNALSSVEDIFMLENVKVTTTSGITVGLGACRNCTVRAQNVSSAGSFLFTGGNLVGGLVSFRNVSTVTSYPISITALSSADCVLELVGASVATGPITVQSSGITKNSQVSVGGIRSLGTVSLVISGASSVVGISLVDSSVSGVVTVNMGSVVSDLGLVVRNVTTPSNLVILNSGSGSAITDASLLIFNVSCAAMGFDAVGAMTNVVMRVENVIAGNIFSIDAGSVIGSNFTLRNIRTTHVTAAYGLLRFATRTSTVNSAVEISNAKLTGALALSIVATNNCALRIADTSVAADSSLATTTSMSYSSVVFERVVFSTSALALTGVMGAGARVLLNNITITNDVINVAVTATANALLEINRLVLTAPSIPVVISLPWSDDSRVTVRDSSISAPAASIGFYHTSRVAHVSIINTYITIGAGPAVRISLAGSAFVTKSLELIGNEFYSNSAAGGGVSVITDAALVSAIITNNKFNMAAALTMPASTSPSTHNRVASCNVDKSGAAMDLTAASLTNSPCSATLTRCQGFANAQGYSPSTYPTRPAVLTFGVADAKAPACTPLYYYTGPDAVAVTPEAPLLAAQEGMRRIPLVNATFVPTPIVAIARIIAASLAGELASLADQATGAIRNALEFAALFFFGSRTVPLKDEFSATKSLVPSVVPASVRAPSSPAPPSRDVATARGADRLRSANVFEGAYGTRHRKIPASFPARTFAVPRDAKLCFPQLETTTPPPTTTATTVTLPLTTDAVTTVRTTETFTTVTTATFTTLAKTTRPTTTTMPTTTLGFSEIFSDDGMSEPVTTTSYQGTYVITDDPGVPENSDVATVPSRFTPPPITENMVTVPDAVPTGEVTEANPPPGPVYPDPTDAPSDGNVPVVPDVTFTIPASLTEAPYVEPSGEEGWFPSQDANETSTEPTWGSYDENVTVPIFPDDSDETGSQSQGSSSSSTDSYGNTSITESSTTTTYYESSGSEESTNDTSSSDTTAASSSPSSPSGTAEHHTNTTESSTTSVTLPPYHTNDTATSSSSETASKATTEEEPTSVTRREESNATTGQPATTSGSSSSSSNWTTTTTFETSAETVTSSHAATATTMVTHDTATSSSSETVVSNVTTSEEPTAPTNATTEISAETATSHVATATTMVSNDTTAPTTNASSAPLTTVTPPASTGTGDNNSSSSSTELPSTTEDSNDVVPKVSRTATLSPTVEVMPTKTIPLTYTCPAVVMIMEHNGLCGDAKTSSAPQQLFDCEYRVESGIRYDNSTTTNNDNNNNGGGAQQKRNYLSVRSENAPLLSAIGIEAERLQSEGLPFVFEIPSDEATRMKFKFAELGGRQEDNKIEAFIATARPSTGIVAVGSFENVYGKRSSIPCTILSLRKASCYLAPRPDFNPPKEEAIAITLPSNAFEVPCDDTTIAISVRFSVAALVSGNAANEAASGVAGVASGATSAAGILAGAAAFDAYVLGMLLNSPCASAADHVKSQVMMYIIAPFKDLSEDHQAMIYGNALLAGVFAALQFGLATHLKKSRHLNPLEAYAAVYFPSYSYVVAELLYTGIAIGTFSIVHEADGPGGYIAALVGFATLFLIPAAAVYTVLKVANPRFHMYTQFLSRKFYRRIFFPQTFVRTEVQRRAFNRHVAPFSSTTGALFGTFTTPTIFLGGFILYLLPSTVSCEVKLWLFAFVLVAAACVLLAARPYRYHSETGFVAIALILLALLTSIMAVQYRENTPGLENAQLIIAFLIFFLILCRVVINVVCTVLEYKYWSKFQEQIVNDLDEDLFNLKDQGEVEEPLFFVDGGDEMAVNYSHRRKGKRLGGDGGSILTDGYDEELIGGSPSSEARRARSIAPVDVSASVAASALNEDGGSFAVGILPTIRKEEDGYESDPFRDDDDDPFGDDDDDEWELEEKKDDTDDKGSFLSSELTNDDETLFGGSTAGSSAAATPRAAASANRSHADSAASANGSDFSDSDISM